MDLSNKLAAQTELLAGEQGRELRKLAAALTDGSRNSSRPREVERSKLLRIFRKCDRF